MRKWKRGFLAQIAWHDLRQEGRKTMRIFVHTICFGPKIICFGTKTVKTRKTIKIVVSAEIAQNPKWHFFFLKNKNKAKENKT